MDSRRSTEWTGWLGKIGRNAKKWQKKHRFFRCVRVQTPGGMVYYEMNYFKNDEDPHRLGSINLFAARGVCWFGQYTRNVEAALVICISTPNRVWFLKGSCAEQITHLMSKLSNIVPQLKIEAQGLVEIPRKQRFLKLKADWKSRFLVALSNRQVLIFNNAGLEEYEATFLMTRYKDVSRRKDESGRQYIVCVVNEKNSPRDRDESSTMNSVESAPTSVDPKSKKMPSVLSVPPKSSKDNISIDTWYNLIRRAIAYVEGRQGLSASDLQLISLMNQIENHDYRATSHAIYAVRKGIPFKMRHNLWCGFSGAKRRAAGILARIETQQKRWKERVTTNVSKELDRNDRKDDHGVHEKGRKRTNTSQRLVDAFETYIAERTGVSMRSTATLNSDKEIREHMESVVNFLIRNMNPNPEEEENISSDMEDAAFRVLVAVATDLMPRYFNGMNAYAIDTRILEKLASERFPALTEHMRYIGIKWREPALIWFRTMFIHLPQSLGGRVWDVIMVEGGSVTMLRVALAIIRLRREQLLLLLNAPTSRDEAMSLLSTESFKDTKEENRRFLRYAFLDIDEFTAKRKRSDTNDSDKKRNKKTSIDSKIPENLEGDGIGSGVGGATNNDNKKRVAALEVAAEIYWEVSRDTPLFRLLVNGMEFSRHVEMHRREQWSRVTRRANGWRQSCEDLRILANEVCILASKYCKYATDLAQILLELKSTAHEIPPGFCDERLLPTAMAARSVNNAIARASSSSSKQQRRQGQEQQQQETNTDRKRLLCVTERLYDITFQLHASICRASTEAIGVKKVQRLWQQELKHVADIAHSASLGREPNLSFGDRKARSGESMKSSGSTSSRMRRQSKTKVYTMNPRLRSDLHHLTSCENVDDDDDEDMSEEQETTAGLKLKGTRRRPQEVVTSLSHALISATWTAISSCWACDNERYWICYFEKSFLLKHDSPSSQLSPHRKLRKLLVHMRLKFRIVAEELVQRLQRVQSCVGEQIRSARRESSIQVSALPMSYSTSPDTAADHHFKHQSPDKIRIQEAIPRLLDALSKLSGGIASSEVGLSSSLSSSSKRKGGGGESGSTTTSVAVKNISGSRTSNVVVSSTHTSASSTSAVLGGTT